ncbi:HNH endonuclease [Paeniglutamicibacter sp. ZC-3]|uniref:HNH endonuclease signature motif containing protein n=1 Tax=Paeniglutamicibacter sp. ZC-3 TaxID=2986919 RepID=UPI0021F7EC0D|nr:HNH endonuclease signature motif containing protein [Paeniglutamicibacter sp. ZC-3]MCV9996060.1 HNH endonuclease [Paeniglutamicibacter sp. ZC-3]
MRTSAAPIPPRGHARTDTAIRHLADAVARLRAAQRELDGLEPDAASAALLLGLLEQGNRAIAYEQLRTAFRADANQVHRLDPDTAAAIDALAADPGALAEGNAEVPPERICPGMAPHRDTASWLQAHLHISATEARRRITGGRLLVAPAPTPPESPNHGQDLRSPDEPAARVSAPLFPLLAGAAADGSADVGTLAQLAGRLESMQPRIAERPDAANLNTAIEESLVHEARTREPRHSHKALADWGTYLAENGAPITDEEILAKRGMVYRGYRDGCDEYLLRCDPIDSETILAFAEAWTNPRSDKLPPASASTGGLAIDPGTGTTGASGPGPDAAQVSDAAAPVGMPAPEWAVAPGTSPDLVPRSEWACGPPATAEGTNAANPTAKPWDTSTWWEARDPRTAPQLLLDGVIAAISGTLNGTGVPESGGLRVKVGVLIGYRALLGQCEDAGITDHGRPISAASIRRLACNGDILPAVLGTEGEILDLGREARSFSPAQRKALAIRDRGCVVPGCHRPAATTEAHHVKPWQEGGPTSVDNGCLTCAFHHLQVHSGLITLKMVNGIPYVIARAGQPRGDPERNLYWHPELRTAGYTPPMFTD